MLGRKAYDLIVVGAGAAGSTAAETALKMGATVALIERDKLGGTCLNYGCDPTKTLLYTARLLHDAQGSGKYGLRIREAEADWRAVTAHVREVIREIRGGTPEEALQALQSKGIDVLMGEARFVSPHDVEVGDRTLTGRYIIIATGTDASVPDVEGLEQSGFITNIEAVSLSSLPRTLAVLGAGPIGVEFAQMFSRFGVDVTVVHRGDVPLPTEDRELAEMLCDSLEGEGIKIKTGVEPKCLPAAEKGKRINLESTGEGEGTRHKPLVVDEILVSIGRKPALGALQLDAAGVETNSDGIKVDATLRTNVPHIWAAGDITGGYQFTHVASAQGKLVATNALSGDPQPFDSSVIPWVTFTDPELAHVGQTEQELQKLGVAYRAGRMPFTDLDRARADGQTQGMVKLLASPGGKLLGAHILGAGAGELIAPLVLAMKASIPIEQMAETILPYPTRAEAVRWAAERLLDAENIGIKE